MSASARRSLASLASPGTAAAIAVAAVALVLPVVLPGPQVSVYVLLLISAIVVTGLSMLMGFAGQVSLGQAAFTLIAPTRPRSPPPTASPPGRGCCSRPPSPGRPPRSSASRCCGCAATSSRSPPSPCS
ncbi:hypothetical protein BJF79_24995 [Actinomadura sp. CNU-125]|uniref:hypothetical protein n=1 Tax=Actinomadura sp. CNU-125 TaxID=1904961 RepID=UPI00095C0A92|nr:hypothetical protein [Actinomadura sp. CNU-125]OLT10996.1 hypothetical protein BJF79_24995 [Actinomadura sp. CNU-125]